MLDTVSEDVIKTLLKSATAWSKKVLVQVGSELMLTPCPWTQGYCVIEQQNDPLTNCK